MFLFSYRDILENLRLYGNRVSVAVSFDCKVYNPILTKQGIKASIRGKKTDKTDAVLIARMGVRGEGRLYTPEPHMTTKLQVRSYTKLGELKRSFNKHTDHVKAMSETVMTKQIISVFKAVEDAIRPLSKPSFCC